VATGMHSVLHTKSQGGEIVFFSPPLARSTLRGERQHSGHGGELEGGRWTWSSEVDSEEMWTRK
jgi:hypothetical protein